MGDEKNEETLKPGGATSSGTGNNAVNYVQLQMLTLDGAEATASGEEVKKKPAASVNYTEVKHTKERRTFRPLFGKKKSKRGNMFIEIILVYAFYISTY